MIKDQNDKIIDSEKRVFLLSDNVIYLNELNNPTPENISSMWNLIGNLMQPGKKYFMLINLVDSELPNAEVREQLRVEQKKYTQQIEHIAVFTGKNRLINLSVKFVMGKGHLKSVSISKTEQEALNEIEKHINK